MDKQPLTAENAESAEKSIFICFSKDIFFLLRALRASVVNLSSSGDLADPIDPKLSF